MAQNVGTCHVCVLDRTEKGIKNEPEYKPRDKKGKLYNTKEYQPNSEGGNINRRIERKKEKRKGANN